MVATRDLWTLTAEYMNISINVHGKLTCPTLPYTHFEMWRGTDLHKLCKSFQKLNKKMTEINFSNEIPQRMVKKTAEKYWSPDLWNISAWGCRHKYLINAGKFTCSLMHAMAESSTCTLEWVWDYQSHQRQLQETTQLLVCFFM